MKSKFLFPNAWRKTGTILFLLGIIIYLSGEFVLSPLVSKGELHLPNVVGILFNDVYIICLIIGLLLTGFSKEKIEDEQIAQLRLDSLQWAIYFNYIIFIILTLVINGLGFLDVLYYNTITPLVFFIIRFRWNIYQINQSLKQTQTI